MRSLLVLLFFIFTSSSVWSAAINDCDPEAIYFAEKNKLREYVQGRSELMSAIIMDAKFFLPLPVRYLSRVPGDGLSYSSSVHPLKSTYFGCSVNKIPKGILNTGKAIDCEYCKSPPSIMKVYNSDTMGGYELRQFNIDGDKVGLIYSDRSYLLLIDNNSAIVEIWWEIITGKLQKKMK